MAEQPASTPAGGANLRVKKKQQDKISLWARVYGVLMLISGILNVVVFVFMGVILGLSLAITTYASGSAATFMEQLSGILGDQSTMAMVLYVLSLAITLVNAVLSIRVGRSLLKSDRRRVALRVRTLIFTTGAYIVISIMLSGVSANYLPDLISLVILIGLSVRVDPSLAAERKLERKLDEMENSENAAIGMEGRDLSGKGYLDLNFFTLFWEFVVCCVLGLVLEIIWHMTVVDPGVYEDRAGLLYGPFSPIYGFGAVLVTLALNRLYNKNPLVVFGVSGVVGGTFEAAVSLFMQFGFGATAWDYSDYAIFGVPDPIAVLTGGRTATMFLIIWGILGLVWVKAFLPLLLKCVNLIPWKLRYAVTAVATVLMLINGTMTLMSLDCWFERTNGVEPVTEAEQFFATYYDNDWMEHRFESMTITPQDSTRIDAAVSAAAEADATGGSADAGAGAEDSATAATTASDA